MNDIKNTFLETLKVHNKSATKARLAIFNYLIGKDTQTISQITKACAKYDRATVYRTLGMFERLSIIHRVNIGWKFKYELAEEYIGHHHHLFCLQCGKTFIISKDSEIENIVNKISTEAGFVATSHQFEIQGYCNNCKKN